MLRLMSMRLLCSLVLCLSLTACEHDAVGTHAAASAQPNHPYSSDDPQGCRYHSCPGPPMPRDTMLLSLDGVPFKNFLMRRTIAQQHVYRVRLIVHVEPGTRIGTYTVGEAGLSYGEGPDGLTGVRIIQRGTQLVDGEALTFNWRPALKGSRSLVVFYEAIAQRKVYPVDGSVGTSVGDFLVR
jgi:hypothetical protein